MGVKVIIAGGRDFDNYELLKQFCDEKLKDYDDIEIVSGTAKGADKLGELYAKEKGYPIKPFPAKWKEVEGYFPISIGENQYGKYNKLAGFNRNNDMADEADILVALPGGNGTAHMIKTAKEKGLKVYKYEN